MTPPPSPPSVFVTTCWTWPDRAAARKHLQRIKQTHSLDMAFLKLRGKLIKALKKKPEAGYQAADALLENFQKKMRMSKRKLKEALQKIGVCIVTATEEFADLPQKLKGRDCCADRKHVKEHAHLRALLIHT